MTRPQAQDSGPRTTDHGLRTPDPGPPSVANRGTCACAADGRVIGPLPVQFRQVGGQSADHVFQLAGHGQELESLGNALIDACRTLKEDLQAHDLADLVGREYMGEWVVDWTTKPGAPTEKVYTHYSYSYATQLVTLFDDGTIEKITAAHDAGKIFNPTLFEGQLEGSIHMGLGYALTEDFPCEDGRIVNDTIKSLGVLRAHHMPEIECIFIETPDPETAYGARGVGEIGLVPTAPAVAGALEAFDGIHRTSLPMKDSPAARAILGRR